MQQDMYSKHGRSSRARKKLRHLIKHQYTKHYDAKTKPIVKIQKQASHYGKTKIIKSR